MRGSRLETARRGRMIVHFLGVFLVDAGLALVLLGAVWVVRPLRCT